MNKIKINDRLFTFLLLLPSIVVMGVLLIYPTLNAFWISLNKVNFREQSYEFILFKNYQNIFTNSEILNSLKVTAIFSISVIVGTIIIGFLIALLLNRDFFLKKLCIAILLVPWAVPPIANGLMWKWIFNARFGAFNNFLMSIGLLDKHVNWFLIKESAIIIVIFTSIYKLLPFTVFLFLASLQTIPKEMYEAAEVDGINVFGKLFRITIPLIRPSLIIILILLTVSTLKEFDMIFVLTNGGPGYGTAVINFMAYIQSFKILKFGQGSALAFFISIMILIINIFYYRVFYKEVRYD